MRRPKTGEDYPLFVERCIIPRKQSARDSFLPSFLRLGMEIRLGRGQLKRRFVFARVVKHLTEPISLSVSIDRETNENVPNRTIGKFRIRNSFVEGNEAFQGIIVTRLMKQCYVSQECYETRRILPQKARTCEDNDKSRET